METAGGKVIPSKVVLLLISCGNGRFQQGRKEGDIPKQLCTSLLIAMLLHSPSYWSDRLRYCNVFMLR